MAARKYFYSSTKDGKIGDDGKKSYGHLSFKDLTCEKIWDKFDMKNMGNYHDHYLKKDVLLLADVFKRFIDTCLRFYELDPCHYFSSEMGWDTMLKMTGIELKKGLIGGISYIAKRYAKANYKYMKDYDPTKPSKCISYLNMNNLYDWTMSSYLPYGGFKWLKNVDNFDLNPTSEKSLI